MFNFDLIDLGYNYLQLLKICSLYGALYPICYGLLLSHNSFSDLKFSKKLYVVKNVIKSGSLAYLTYITIPYVPDLLTLSYLDMNLVRWWGTLFVANDLTALILVPNLPANTRNHHIMTVVLLNIVYLFDGNQVEIIKLISIYTIFSYYAFLVNLYLGMRFLVSKNTENNQIHNLVNNIIDKLRVLAYYNYAICLALNWSFHIYYLWVNLFNLSLFHLLYFIFLVPIIKDDLILLGWLKNKTVNN